MTCRKQQRILAINGENQRKREQADKYKKALTEAQIAFEEAKARLSQAEKDAIIAAKSAEDLIDESTAEIEANISEIEEINRKVRANLEKEKAEEEAKYYSTQYAEATDAIENIRKEKYELLNNAQLPLPGLSVQDKELTYKGYKWDNMSSSDQLKTATAIVRKLNPECGFVLIDKLEQMDVDTLQNFGQWLEAEGLQAIATRVSNGDECSIIIDDGYIQDIVKPDNKKEWKAGVF